MKRNEMNSQAGTPNAGYDDENELVEIDLGGSDGGGSNQVAEHQSHDVIGNKVEPSANTNNHHITFINTKNATLQQQPLINDLIKQVNNINNNNNMSEAKNNGGSMNPRAAAVVKYTSVSASVEEADTREKKQRFTDPDFSLLIDDREQKRNGMPRDETKEKPKLFGRKKSSENITNDENRDVTTLGLFRFADCIDMMLILIGVVASLISAGVYPVMFVMYGQVAGTLVDLEKFRTLSSKNLINNDSINIISNLSTTISTTETPTNSKKFCYKLSNPDVDFDARIERSIVLYLMFGSFSLLFTYLGHVCLNTSGERQIKRIRNKLFESIIRQDMSFFDVNNPGELNTIISDNLNQIKVGISYKISDFISMGGRGIACILLAMITAWRFSIVFLAIMPFVILSTMLTITIIKRYTIREFQSYGMAGRIAQEVLSSIRTVIALGMQKMFIKFYGENLSTAEKLSIKKGLLTGLFSGITSGLFNACFGIGIYYATYLVRVDCEKYSPGNLVLSFFSIVTTSFAIGQVLPFIKDLSEARGAAKKVYGLIEKKSLIDVFESKGLSNIELKGAIQFEKVQFEYPTRKNMKILKGLNINIPAGKTVALCGSSGGGKSTLIGLLQRFYLESSGTIKIDGRSIDDYELEWLRSQMALVSQEPVLFSTTIKENIRLGRLDATDAEVIEAAKMANAHNFIMNCTQQYDTECGERGTQLSGGQKQRIAIARALLRNPKILLLDEATSALDYESEKIVQDALDRVKVGRTTIIIAHRLSTIRNADLIYALAGGVVKEFGTHDELMKLNGLYAELVMMQTKEAKNKEEKTNDDIEVGKNTLPVLSESDDDDEDDDEEEEINEEELDANNNTDTPFKRQDTVTSKKSIKSRKSDQQVINKKHATKKKHKPYYLERFLFRFHKPDTIWLIFGAVAQMINGALMPGISLVFTEIYGIFTIEDPKLQEELSIRYMSIILVMAVFTFSANLLYNFFFSLCGARLTKRVRVKMFESMLRQEIAFHDSEENRSSILSTQLAVSAPFCKGLTSDKISLLCQGFSSVGLAIIVAFIISWKLSLAMCAFVPITFVSGLLTGKSNTNTKVNGKMAIEEGGRLTTEVIENIKTVVSLGREKYFLGQFKTIFNKKFRKTLLVLHSQAFFYAVSNSMLFFVQTVASGLGYRLIISDGLSIPNLYKVYATITFSSMVLGRVYSQMPDQRKARASTKTAYKIITRKPKIDSMDESGLKPAKVIGDIKFTDVHFHYPQRSSVKILNGLNLEVKNGTTNALVGPSGCGKSTTIALLLRFYDIESGSITLDGVDIRQLNIQWLRTQIGLVSQEPVLFNYSIKQNIMYGDCDRTDISMSEIMEACRQSNINAKIESLPEKYDTLAGSRGGQLSGGEKQRIAIARALIRKPKILLLDEATSALDTQSEQVVQEALDNAQKGRTCMVIAHRLSTIQNSDKISVFKDGLLLEEGTHQELMKLKSFYYNLQSQNKIDR